jgi:hypothetical protein
MSHRSLLRHTTLRAFAQGADWSPFHAAVSLHAHTHHSCEVLSDLPPYISKIPFVGPRFDREIDRRRARDQVVDFSKGWWHPPASPRAVFESETAQIDERFGLASFVSVTDHDDITAGLELQRLYAARRAPISFEWTVPFHEGFFHLGVHDLASRDATAWFEQLSALTRGHGDEGLDDMLDALHAAGVLIVFNHPLWDLAGVGEAQHVRRLREFLDAHQSRIHAFEINGYRSRGENGGVRTLSRERCLPLISGGDRHALAPNAVLNVTRATTFAEFAAEIRDGVSHVVVMPEYQQHLAARIVESANDVLASYRTTSTRWQRWTDRVSCEFEGNVRPLSHHWPDGGPLWVRSAIATFKIVTAAPVMRVWRAVAQRGEANTQVTPIPTVS